MKRLRTARAKAPICNCYVSQTQIVAENGKVTGVEYQRTKLGEPDASGRRRPVPIPGSEFTIEMQHRHSGYRPGPR